MKYRKLRGWPERWRVVMLLCALKFVFLSAYGQQANLSGRVTAANGSPLPFVNVLIKGSSIGTQTDTTGFYTLKTADNNGTLSFSFIGFQSLEVPMGGRLVVDAIMSTDVNNLDEVVVVGYGTQQKRDITGAIASISAKKLAQVPALNAAQSLQGMAAGVDVYNTSQAPGAVPQIRIRGNRSINASNQPLIVVDGIPLIGNLNDVNSNDIESMEVLKDASATAIYGSRGANGVVIISTKRGKAGPSKISYSAYYGVQKELRRLDMMNGAQVAAFRREARRATGNYNSDKPSIALDQNVFYFPDPNVIESVAMAYDAEGNYDPAKVRSFDWLNEVMRTGTVLDHQLSFSGGSEKTRFSVSGGYYKNTGILKGFDYSRSSIRMTVDHQLNKIITFGGTISGSFNKNNETANTFLQALRMLPLAPIYDENGVPVLYPAGETSQSNPVNRLNNTQNEHTAKHFYGSFFVEAKLLDGLTYKLNFGPDFRLNRSGTFQGSLALLGGLPTSTYSTGQNFHYTLDNQLNFNRTFAGKHKVMATLLHSVEQDVVETSAAGVQGLPYEYQLWYNLGSASTINSLGSNYQKWRLNSYMGRFNYSFNGKYLVTLTGRYDGSSRLAEGNKFNFFPSVAVGWNISEEDFLKSWRPLSELKLRASHGNTGNTSISPYQTLGSLGRTSYANDNSPAFGYQPNLLYNPNLKWENTGQTDIGLDFGLFNYRISGSIDWYRQLTTDLILSRQLPTASGFGQITENIGRTRNTGIEISLNAKVLDNRDGLSWSTDWIFTKNKEAILELANGKVNDIGNKWFIGQPVATHYDFKKIGIWQNTPEDLEKIKGYNANGSTFAPGEIKLEDIDGNGRINQDDRVILGSAVPKWSGSFSSTFAYKGVDLSFMLFARMGQKLNDGFDLQDGLYEGRFNWLNVNYWTPENPSNDYPRPRNGRQVPLNSTALNYHDASFVRVRQISLGYTLPKTVLNAMRMSQLRIYVTALNPFLFTKYMGSDPEGATGFTTPSTRTTMCGVSLSF